MFPEHRPLYERKRKYRLFAVNMTQEIIKIHKKYETVIAQHYAATLCETGQRRRRRDGVDVLTRKLAIFHVCPVRVSRFYIFKLVFTRRFLLPFKDQWQWNKLQSSAPARARKHEHDSLWLSRSLLLGHYCSMRINHHVIWLPVTPIIFKLQRFFQLQGAIKIKIAVS